MTQCSGKELWHIHIDFDNIVKNRYFYALASPTEIHHLDYFKYCSPRSSDKHTLHRRWLHVILPKLKASKIQQVSGQHGRLVREWLEQAAETKEYWDKKVEEEANDTERQLERKHRLILQANAVDQLDAQLQHYTKKVRGLATPASNTAHKGGGLKKMYPRQGLVLIVDDGDCPSGTAPPLYSSLRLLRTDLPSTDPADMSFVDQGGLKQSTSRLYTWNLLDGPGRVDSDVDSHWVYNGMNVGGDLMACRNRIVENKGGLTEPYEKLVVNFVFLVEAKYQTGGLEGEVEDQIWDSLCDAVIDPVQPLSNEVVVEAHQWAHRLAQNTPQAFAQLLDDSPPQNRTLQSILTKMAGTAQLWDTRTRNEDSSLRSQLGPFLDAYFDRLRYTQSDWSPTQRDIRGSESSLLIPDYATTTYVRRQQVSVMLLEDKIAKNVGLRQIWDDLTKLGQKMKVALDSILKLQPEDDVCVIGVLVREPSVEFYTMWIHAEATYIMHRFAAAYIPADAMNAFPLVRLMEVFEHAKEKVEQTVGQLRRVKVHASPTPKVPLSWLRPSFKKPKLYQIVDGQ